MNCPRCGTKADLKTPDYGYGKGTEFVCYRCDVYGHRFVDKSEKAQRESAEARAISSANAKEYK